MRWDEKKIPRRWAREKRRNNRRGPEREVYLFDLTLDMAGVFFLNTHDIDTIRNPL